MYVCISLAWSRNPFLSRSSSRSRASLVCAKMDLSADLVVFRFLLMALMLSLFPRCRSRVSAAARFRSFSFLNFSFACFSLNWRTWVMAKYN